MNTDRFPRVAILLAAYNGMQWIEEQVDSILSQKNIHVSIYISVDYSSDGTDKWVAELARSYSNVTMLPYGERFGGAGPNFFRLIKEVDFSEYDAVALADQDDIWFENKLQKACELIGKGLCEAYSSNVTAFWPGGKKLLIEKSQPQKKYDHFFEAAGPGCTYVLSSKAACDFKLFLEEVGGKIKDITLHDWLIYAYCRNKNYTWFIDPNPSMLYRQHGGNQVGTNTGITAFKKRFELINKHWYRKQVFLITEIVAPDKLAKIKSYTFRISNFYLMRRRLRDAIALFVMFLFGGF